MLQVRHEEFRAVLCQKKNNVKLTHLRLFDFMSLQCQGNIKLVIEISSARVLVEEQRTFCFIK